MVPLRQQGDLIGELVARRMEVRPFTPAQIKLLETFADQAVIAIENVRLVNELKESLEQQTATSEILGVIASSPTDVQPVLDVVAQNAARLCDASDAVIWRADGDWACLVASHGSIPMLRPEEPRSVTRSNYVGRALMDRETVHIHDILSPESRSEFPEAFRSGSIRTVLVAPLLREGVAIGAIHVRRPQIRPFSDKQIALLKTFADQAVIAIENVRLFKEIQERNAELREALEHQTATSEVLGIISRSPTDVQPVLDAIVESAARVCGIDDVVLRLNENDSMVSRAHFGPIPIPIVYVEISMDAPPYRWMREHGTLHVPDVRAQNDFPMLGSEGGWRTFLLVPLCHQGEVVGTLGARRTEVRPFTLAQIKLLETFADQAVIAIENVRLFNELKESLEQQTATSEILGVIASSPTDVQPVLDTVAEHAARLCDARDALIFRVNGDRQERVASYGSMPVLEETSNSINFGGPVGRAIGGRQTIHVHDLAASESEFPGARNRGIAMGVRTALIAPLLREGVSIGAIYIRRNEVRPFSERQIKLLETFASQAVIAIENVRLFKELQERNRDLTEALEQQTATSEVLSVIGSSPTDLQPVMNAIVESAARLCDAYDSHVHRVDGEILRLAASHGDLSVAETLPISRETVRGRAVIDGRTIHIHDILAVADDFTESGSRLREFRTLLATPLLREGVPIGLISMRRKEVRPFTDKQIALLKTFADQAVIAIENVRLFQELQSRNAELREALEHQTATAEVLGIISRSPTDVQPVLDAIVESAARVCGIEYLTLRLHEGNTSVPRALFGSMPIARPEYSIDEPQIRWIREHGTLHVPDVRAQNEFPMLGSAGNSRTFLIVPLRQKGELIGTLNARRTEVRPFTPVQIKLLETFADQAVIAIENVRLFNELKESLEQQTATSEILGVIASSPTDIQPVLDVVAENAARLCESVDAQIYRAEGDNVRKVASYGSISPVLALGDTRPLSRSLVGSRAIVDRQLIHIHDMMAEREDDWDFWHLDKSQGVRTILAVPLLREDVPIGSILIRRTEVRPFTDKQIALLKTFADQAVIAIENVRLFKELQVRNRDLTEALEQQTATSEILGVIASSPTDLQPVFQTILDNAVRLCEAQNGAVFRFDGEVFRALVWNNISPALSSYVQNTPIPPGRESALRRVGLEKRPVHIPDMLADPECVVPTAYREEGMRTNLAVPLLKENNLIGAIAIHRREVRPFTETQIKLLETFASQAVIAIENVRLFQELQARNRDLTEALEQQTATSEVLRVIASSPTELQPVLDTVIENAVTLAGAKQGHIRQYDGEFLRVVAHYNETAEQIAKLQATPTRPGLESLTGRAFLERKAQHILDAQAEPRDVMLFYQLRIRELGMRTLLTVPLLREGAAIGTISIWRDFVEPFTERQMELVETFADQAVIAIENVRLFKELQERNAELREALEHQTATSEVLGIISRSPTDVQPVLDAIVESAARVCGVDDVHLRLHEGDVMISRAHFGPIPIARAEISIDEPNVRWVREHGTHHIPDVRAENENLWLRSGPDVRTFLSVPLHQKGDLVGLLNARRIDVRPFTSVQIKLLETFADQAVIAIENVRLFQELKESLEQQTATSEILGVIASSPTDIQPVLDVVAKSAARLCGSDDAQIYRVEADLVRKVASYGVIPTARAVGETRPVARGTVTGRAILDRQIIHIQDMMTERDEDYPEARRIDEQMGIRTSLAVPLLREGVAVGAILIRRTEVRPFNDKQVALLKTFADQAVIAIENVRLFKELQERNAELREALEYQTATAEVLGIISRSPTDVQPVLDAIVESAARVCGIDDVVLRLHEGNIMVARAHFGAMPIGRAEISTDEPQVRWMREHGTLHIPDVRALNDFPTLGSAGWRTLLAVPLRQQGELIGSLTRVAPRFGPSPRRRSSSSKPSPIKPSSRSRTFGCSKNSKNRWNSKRRRVRFLASSPVRRRTCNQFWILWRKMRHDCATRGTH